MLKIIFTVVVSSLFILLPTTTQAQERYYGNNNRTTRPDSTYFNGKWYPNAIADSLKKEYQKLNFQSNFIPGLAYTVFTPKASGKFGVFSGVSVEYLLSSNVYQNNDPGPSHVRSYAKLDLLNSNKDSVSALFKYAIGVDVSFEKMPNRNYLIPYFGLEFGGISQKLIGTTAHFVPTAGIHLIAKKNLYINVLGGYVYPIKQFEELQGFTGQIRVNFSMW
jgi:hypothetical protein